MANKTMKVEIVSPEGAIYSGQASMLIIKGAEGDLGISPGHLQLLTRVVPGVVQIMGADNHEELLYISGGILEVQPHQVSILADTAERPQDVNEAAAVEAKKEAERLLAGKEAKLDQQQVRQQLAEAMAKLRVLEIMRSRKKH